MRVHLRRAAVIALLAIVVLAAGGGGWLLLTPSGRQVRDTLIDSILTTKHRRLAVYLIGQKAYERREAAYREQFDRMAEAPQRQLAEVAPSAADARQPVSLEEIHGLGYNGYILSVSDPRSIRVCVPGKAGVGETVSDMARRTGAIAGINGGGFVDPKWKGNGFLPYGIVMSDGKLLFRQSDKDDPVDVVGIDGEGHLLAGKFKPSELGRLGMREAVSFYPRLIVNGKGLLASGDDSWGIAPRTAIGQKEDGTILLAVIDGRQAKSIGATLYDVQQLLLSRGAVIAANLDGGASSDMFLNGRTVNHPSAGAERYVPTAFLVYENPDRVAVPNVWEGLDPSGIDPSAWGPAP